MEWYWWALIATVLVAIGVAKYFIMKKYTSKKYPKSNDNED